MIRGHAEPQRIDVLPGLSKMTLDVIGLSGFGSQFDTLNPKTEPNPIQKALEQLFRASDAGRESILQKAVPILPILGYLVIIQLNSHGVSEPYTFPSHCPAAKTWGRCVGSYSPREINYWPTPRPPLMLPGAPNPSRETGIYSRCSSGRICLRMFRTTTA